MATSRKSDNPTPNGGVRSEVLFQDDDGNAVDEAEATHAEVLEYDAQGNVIQRTYARLKE